MGKQFNIIIFLIIIISTTIYGQSVTLESVEGSMSGLILNDTLPQDELITFKLRLTNDDVTKNGITNGFKISSPDIGWNTITGDTLEGFDSMFDLVYEIRSSAHGSIVDTIGFGGSRAFSSGFPANYNEVCYFITIGPIHENCNYSGEIVLDTTFYEPAGTWKWASSGLDQYPSWDGPHIFHIEKPTETTNISITPYSIIYPISPNDTNVINDSIFVSYTFFGITNDFSISENCDWISLDTNSGTTPEYISFTVTNPLLGEGLFVDTITVFSEYACNTPLYFQVVLNITDATGDYNLDGVVNIEDLFRMVDLFLQQGPPPSNLQVVDFDNNNIIDITDLIALVYLILF